jgi:hypothetical protein
MQWNRKELSVLASSNCTICQGFGVRRERHGEPVPCGCALRSIFRACHARFRACVMRGKHKGPANFDRAPGARGYKGTWGRKEEEFTADFVIVARRNLDAWQYQLFRFQYLLGADPNLVRKRLGLQRGAYFHAMYRIEEHLGQTYTELQPYALYPTKDYFSFRSRTPVEPCDPRTVIMPSAAAQHATRQATFKLSQMIPLAV